MMNRNKIFHDIGFSIRKVNEDEIEIKNSTFDGYLRGFFRTLIIGIFSVIAFLDLQHKETPLLGIYQSIEKDFIWAFNPDKIIKPLYSEYVIFETNPEMIKKYNITKKGALIAYVKGKDSNYKKMISAHVDTLGAVVKKVKKNGRLEITNVGGFAWGSVEGEHVTIHTLSEKTYTGTILPIKASVHVYGDVAREMPRTEETMEIRIDEDVKTDQDVFKLGILQGDFVSLDPRTRVLENGYIKSRYLDDKLCVAQILTYLLKHSDQSQSLINIKFV